jgi:hypothetical protein
MTEYSVNLIIMRFLISLAISFLMTAAVLAKLPVEMETILKTEIGDYKERLDMVLKMADQKWLLLKPDTKMNLNEEGAAISLISKTADKDFLFSNGWIYTPIKDNTIKSFDYFPDQMQDVILKSKIHQEFIVPKGFKLPRDLAFLAGRIPMELGDIELATDREELYAQRLAKIESKKPFQFLAYSFNSGELSEIKVDKNSKEKLGEARDLQAKELGLKYLSSVKEHQGETYFSDLITGEIFKLSKTREKYDATKPNLAHEVKPIETNIEKVFSLQELGVNDGIKDFAFNLSKSFLYVITKKESNLLIIKFKEKMISKKLELPKMIDGFELISRSTQEPDKLVFFSKAKDTIFFLNTFDLRISDQIFLDKISKETAFVPYSVLVTYDKIFIGVEKISKANHLSTSAGIMVFDTITNSFQNFIELDSVPKELLLSQDKKSFFILEENKDFASIKKMDIDKYQVLASLKLDADIAQISSLTEIVDGRLLVIPSSVSNNILFVDVDDLVALKKIEVKEPINLLRVIN